MMFFSLFSKSNCGLHCLFLNKNVVFIIQRIHFFHSGRGNQRANTDSQTQTDARASAQKTLAHTNTILRTRQKTRLRPTFDRRDATFGQEKQTRKKRKREEKGIGEGGEPRKNKKKEINKPKERERKRQKMGARGLDPKAYRSARMGSSPGFNYPVFSRVNDRPLINIANKVHRLLNFLVRRSLSFIRNFTSFSFITNHEIFRELICLLAGGTTVRRTRKKELYVTTVQGRKWLVLSDQVIKQVMILNLKG